MALERKGWNKHENIPVFEMHAVDGALAVCSHHTVSHSIRLTQSSLESSPELAVRKRWGSIVITRNHEMLGQATAGQLQAAALSVGVIYQSASTVPCAVSAWYSYSRDQPNSATMLASK